MKTNQELKNSALQALSGHWKPSVLATLLLFVIMGIANICQAQFDQGANGLGSLFSLAYCIFVTGPLIIGFYNACQRLLNEHQDSVIENMFSIAFNRYLHNVALYALLALKIFLWTLLLIIPGIIKSLSYSMAPFIAIEHPEYSVSEAINASKAMMKGHKMRLFLLCLSFIGWMILGLLTLGIGYLWLMPYMYTTVAAFYNNIKAQE